MISSSSRRRFMLAASKAAGGAALVSLPPAIQRALAMPAVRRAGTIEDVKHIVVLMLENRSFDHYFSTLPGVRGFADRFPIPLAGLAEGSSRVVWDQQLASRADTYVRPFRLDTSVDFSAMRVTGAPHVWSNAQQAWNHGRIDAWPTYKRPHSMAYYGASDLPFQFALANAFTIADAYHCSFQGGTNPNRCYLFSGTVDGQPRGDGPAIGNLYNTLKGGDPNGGYAWTTYPERLEAAGVSWRIYQNMEVDFFALNPLLGFRQYRDAYLNAPGSNANLKSKALSTYDLDVFREDVANDTLPQVSWICPTAHGSEHPGPSSPAEGAQYTSDVLDALTANPQVWGSTVLLVMFDENDGFFDHVPPPAAPSVLAWKDGVTQSSFAGASSVDTSSEYHQVRCSEADDTEEFLHRPYGLGPRVPMYAISPWSKGGWVSSEVFDHTSVLRFIERRFGVIESNISAWRRAVCGDLTGMFDFSLTNQPVPDPMPSVREAAKRARSIVKTYTPRPPLAEETLLQPSGPRPSRALPYRLEVNEEMQGDTLTLEFVNVGTRAVVLHVYDRLNLTAIPRRYTVAAGTSLKDQWAVAARAYDVWLLGPNGFHRQFAGAQSARLRTELALAPERTLVMLGLVNDGPEPLVARLDAAVYGTPRKEFRLAPGARADEVIDVSSSRGWYDLRVSLEGATAYARHFAGRIENGQHSTSDPAMFGPAMGPSKFV